MSEKSKKALLVVAFISIFVIGIFAGKFSHGSAGLIRGLYTRRN